MVPRDQKMTASSTGHWRYWIINYLLEEIHRCFQQEPKTCKRYFFFLWQIVQRKTNCQLILACYTSVLLRNNTMCIVIYLLGIMFFWELVLLCILLPHLLSTWWINFFLSFFTQLDSVSIPKQPELGWSCDEKYVSN